MDLTQSPIAYIHKNFDRFLKELQAYARIPSISAPGFPKEPLEASAQWTAQRMQQAGLCNVELLRVSDAPPFVYGEWLKAPGKPTVLLYAHYDVQPPGREAYWKSSPFEPQIREGRLYGRGTADDKAGGMMHLAAIEAYLKTAGELPVNIRFIIEGEEEVGSIHLQDFLKFYQERLQADVMVLTDTANLDVGLPSITYRLRGLVDAIVEVRTLDHPVHSGMWGGPVIDALTALNQVLSRLVTREGKIAIPGFCDDVALISKTEQQQLQRLPFADEKFRREVGAVASLQWAGDSQKSVYEKIWCEPALAILGVDAPSVATTSNQIVEWARAKISIRIVNDQDPKKMLRLLCDFLQQEPPFGCEVKATAGAAGDPWKGDIEGPAFRVAQRALAKGYGREPVFIGCGGSIPFVKPLTDAFPNMPALLIGVEDPYTNAHGENESLHIEDWKKGILSAVYLYKELAAQSSS